MLQAAISLLINATCLKVSLNEDKMYAGITTLDIVGAIIFGIGFLMEAISDHQL
jgi:steroid 5-alpha reductase family enzyme